MSRVFIIIILLGAMQLIKALLSPRSRLQFDEEVKLIILQTGVKSKGLLAERYSEIVNKYMGVSKNPYKVMRLLINKLEDMDSLESIVKLLVVIHGSLMDGGYLPEVLSALEDMELVINRKFSLEKSEEWFIPFYRAYCSYLAKLPSISEVLTRTFQVQTRLPSNHFCLTDLFRLLNQMCLLMPALNSMMNTIGRYYSRKILLFQQLYYVLRREILTVYSYMRHLIDDYMLHYEQHNINDAHCFFETIPEIELLVDKMDDFLVNKYFKGSAPSLNIYIKEEQVQKAYYYLKRNHELA